ncbi:protein SOB FIVE-LIKE 5-like [Henckelia pumila]|uniref:protein SOB FIVE-LIKE 5-like n=1 Tax=Henckelia pumila TaxID=405737 RepID=UPI003C6E5E2A
MEYICPFEEEEDNQGLISSSSGCESGWTLYLGHDDSSLSNVDVQEHDFFGGRNRVCYEDEDEDEDEDLSMVSDASSGPPHLNEEDSYVSTGKDNININAALSGKNLKRQKIEENRRRIKDNIANDQDQCSSSLLDDTASSPFFGERFTHTRSRQEKELDYSQGYSTTHLQGRANDYYHETHDFFQSSVSGNQLYQNQWFEEKRW